MNDFEFLVSLNVFNSSHMNGEVYNSKRYKDASLEYTGIKKHDGEKVGVWDTVLGKLELEGIFENRSMW